MKRKPRHGFAEDRGKPYILNYNAVNTGKICTARKLARRAELGILYQNI